MDTHKKCIIYSHYLYCLIILIGIMSIIPDTSLDKVSDTYKLFSGGYLFHILGYGVFLFFCSDIQYNISKAFFIYHTTIYIYL